MTVTQEEFTKAVAVIHKALQERVVARGLTSTYNYMHTVVDEVVISRRDPRPRATYYYEESDGYTERQVMGTQESFEVTVMSAAERLELDLKQARTKYEDALKHAVTKEKELAESQHKLRELELEVARLRSST